jgi:hypothetical protein
MKKLTTLVCALAVLAFAAPALAQNDDVLDEDHIDDPANGKYVFWDEDEMNAFLAEYAATVEAPYDEGGGVLDTCEYQIPIAYAVSTYHVGRPGHWHVDVDVDLHAHYSYIDYYRVCTNGVHMYANVAGLKTNWKTTEDDACDYCDLEDWEAYYKKEPATSWTPFTTIDCWYGVPPYDDTFYLGEETSGDYDDSVTYNYNAQGISIWAYGGDILYSEVIGLTTCP